MRMSCRVVSRRFGTNPCLAYPVACLAAGGLCCTHLRCGRRGTDAEAERAAAGCDSRERLPRSRARDRHGSRGGRPAAGTARLQDAHRRCVPCCWRPVLCTCMAAPACVDSETLQPPPRRHTATCGWARDMCDHRHPSADAAAAAEGDMMPEIHDGCTCHAVGGFRVWTPSRPASSAASCCATAASCCASAASFRRATLERSRLLCASMHSRSTWHEVAR